MDLVRKGLPRDEQTVVSSVNSVYQKGLRSLVTWYIFHRNTKGSNPFEDAESFQELRGDRLLVRNVHADRFSTASCCGRLRKANDIALGSSVPTENSVWSLRTSCNNVTCLVWRVDFNNLLHLYVVDYRDAPLVWHFR